MNSGAMYTFIEHLRSKKMIYLFLCKLTKPDSCHKY